IAWGSTCRAVVGADGTGRYSRECGAASLPAVDTSADPAPIVIARTTPWASMLALTMDPAQASAAPCDTPDLATLYQQWFRPVYRWIRVLAGPGVDAEDLAQEVFIVVQRKLEQF